MKYLGLALVALLTVAPPAGASTITFVTSGSNQGSAVSAQAVFAFSGSTLTLTLTNTTPNLAVTNQELVGISWSVGSAALPTLTGVAPDEVLVLCTPTKHNNTCPKSTGKSPYSWVVSSAAPGQALLAPDKGWHPYAIINDDYDMSQSNGSGNLSNSQHNPFLVAPVFTLTSAADAPSDVTFYWGTNGGETSGTCEGATCAPPVPEPASMLLLGTGLLGTGYFARRKRK